MKCPNCDTVIPRECREDIDNQEITPAGEGYGKIYRDVGALYTCPCCTASYRYLPHKPRGERMRPVVRGVDSGRSFMAGDDEPVTQFADLQETTWT